MEPVPMVFFYVRQKQADSKKHCIATWGVGVSGDFGVGDAS